MKTKAHPSDWYSEVPPGTISATTLKVYRSAAKGLLPHCKGPLPDGDAVIARAQELAQSGGSADTMRMALSAANAALRAAGEGEIPPEAKKEVAEIAKGASGSKPARCVPLRAEHLRMIEDAGVKPRPWEGLADAKARHNLDLVIIGLARAAMLKPCELVRCRMDDFNTDGADGTKLSLKRLRRNGAAECSIEEDLMDRILAVRRGVADGRVVPLCANQIANRVKKAAEDAGIEGVTLRSILVGKAQDMAVGGASVAAIREAGGWSNAARLADYVHEVISPSGSPDGIHQPDTD